MACQIFKICDIIYVLPDRIKMQCLRKYYVGVFNMLQEQLEVYYVYENWHYGWSLNCGVVSKQLRI